MVGWTQVGSNQTEPCWSFYRDWGYPLTARNPQEQEIQDDELNSPPQPSPLPQWPSADTGISPNPRTGDSSGSRRKTRSNRSNRSNTRRREEYEPNRYFRPRYQPRYLCFLTDEKLYPRDTTFLQRKPTAQTPISRETATIGSNSEAQAMRKELGYMCLGSDEWPWIRNGYAAPEYVFVSYTTAQFCVVGSIEELDDWKRSGTETPYTNTEKLRILAQSARD
jgi:hypothetical protein